ncbi:MAG: protein kinase [Kofleriaceae bacterium]|nr:protein kinase [Kofleriaceae bacterium]MCL4223760.1 protein kinase [Myxococcales bacterium]
MARPTGVRTLAGYLLGERIAHDLYGEVFAATQGKQAAALLVVDPRLAGDPQFADALARGTAPLLDAFHHRAVVGTLLVAQDGPSLVVVTEAVAGTTPLSEVVARVRARGGKVPPRVAAAIARSVIDALATAHAVGITHGALHPRSVLVDREGGVRVTDFAVGHATMSAAAAGSESVPLKGLAGYLAPELALGDRPTPASDVYAVGALLFTMLSGETPPGSLNTSPAIERLVQRALDTDLARRFGDAIELQENFGEALEDDRWEGASPGEVARFVADLAPGPEANLDAATEDLLASLGGAVDVTRPTAGGAAAGEGTGAGSGGAAGEPVTRDPLGSQLEQMAQVHAGRRARPALDSVLSELEDSSTDGPLTMVDEPRGQVARDPISELIALEEALGAPTNVVDPDGSRATDLDEGTPLPPPQPDEPGTLTREAQSGMRSIPRRPESAPRPSRLVEKTRPRGSLEATPPPEPVTPAPSPPPPAATPEAPRMRFVKPADDDALAPVEVPRLGRSPLWTWLGLAVLLGGGLALYLALRDQGERRTRGEQEAAARKAQQEEERAALERRLRAEQADPGSIRVTSAPDQAAVWLLLGRTPFDSIPLKTGGVWELRVELDGHQTQDVRVGGRAWSGKPEELRARIDVTLAAGETTPPLPAMPAAPPADDQVGLVDGSGSLRAESRPAGAAVWLLVGVTNTMELTGIEAGQAYELKVTKDGFVPGYVRITAEEWRLGGDPNLPLSAAPKREVIERSVELVPLAKKPR